MISSGCSVRIGRSSWNSKWECSGWPLTRLSLLRSSALLSAPVIQVITAAAILFDLSARINKRRPLDNWRSPQALCALTHIIFDYKRTASSCTLQWSFSQANTCGDFCLVVGNVRSCFTLYGYGNCPIVRVVWLLFLFTILIVIIMKMILTSLSMLS